MYLAYEQAPPFPQTEILFTGYEGKKKKKAGSEAS